VDAAGRSQLRDRDVRRHRWRCSARSTGPAPRRGIRADSGH
jgi:hypothetical protein